MAARPSLVRVLVALAVAAGSLAITPADPSDAPSEVSLAGLCRAADGLEAVCAGLDDTPLRAEDFPGVRTVPDPACPEDYLGSGGMIVDPYPFPFRPEEHTGEGGDPAPPEVAAEMPGTVHLRGTTETFTHEYDFVAHEGRIYTRLRFPREGDDDRWHQVLLPRCLDGRVTEISSDGFVLIATDEDRAVYSLDFARGKGWTRRWGAFFWTDLGAALPGDVTDWDASELHSGFDGYFVDRAGRKQDFWGILMLYLLRGDGTRITYLDPWLPVDESREICPPERGRVVMEGLSASGSTAMVITSEGHVHTRLYDFDISGANNVLHSYSWQDQHGVEDPLIQLPAPDWVRHPDVPGAITDEISIRKISPGTEHRILRVEGADEAGTTGYWEKDIQLDDRWEFTPTGEPLRGELLPTDGPHGHTPEEYDYVGTIDGHPARIRDLNPYCSPTTLEIDFVDDTLELVLHTVDGLRQERRGRGFDLYPRKYRSAVEVPRGVWQGRARFGDDVQAFLDEHFEQRFLVGPMSATLAHVQLQEPCWDLFRTPEDVTRAVAQPPAPDGGTAVSESPLLSAVIPQLLRQDPQLEALLAETEDGTFGLGVRACPPAAPPAP